MTVKFVSYDGKWPCLCHGTLVLDVDGKEFKFFDGLSSGGYVSWRSNKIVKGEWYLTKLQWPEDFPKEAKDEAIDVINANVPKGCCGGCI
jgi:hypothetical protein